MPGAVQMNAAGQFAKSMTTLEFAMGLLARSRTTTSNGMSPNGHATRQGGTVEFTGEGTAAVAGRVPNIINRAKTSAMR